MYPDNQALKKQFPHLFRFANAQRRKKLFKLLATDAIALFVVFMSRGAMKNMGSPTPLIAAVVACLVTFGILAPPRGILFGRIYVGKITKIKHVMRRVENKNQVTGIKAMKDAHQLDLYLTNDGGKQKKIVLGAQYASAFQTGDLLVLIPGLPYPLVLDGEWKDRKIACPVCGTIAPLTEDFCNHCGTSVWRGEA